MSTSTQHVQDEQQKRNIVIVGVSRLPSLALFIPRACPLGTNIHNPPGGGIIGSTTAYYLTRHPKFNPVLHTITLLEASSIAAGASGKSGGLLALWAYPQCLVPLSYRLHRELAAEHGGVEKWGYRRLRCGSIAAVVTRAHIDARGLSRDTPQAKPPPAAQLTTNTLLTTREDTRANQAPPVPMAVDPIAYVNGAAAQPAPVAPEASLRVPSSAASVTRGREEQAEFKAEDDGGRAVSCEMEPDEDDKDWEKLPKQDVEASSLLADSPLPSDLDWVDPKLVHHFEEMGRRGFTETAQVHPHHFTTALADLAGSAGVDIRIGAKVTGITPSQACPDLKSVQYEDRNRDGETKSIDLVTDVIVTAGPWTGKLLPRSKVEGLRAHSVVYAADVSPYAVFTDIQLPGDYIPQHRASVGQKRKHRGNVDPEVYARPFGEVYACGEPDKTVPLPDTADQVQTDEAQCDDLVAYLATVSPTLAAAPIKAKQACYIPQHVRFGTERGPLVGPTSQPGVWIAAGHTCWGVQNGPGTGFLMAEWIFDGEAKAADVDILHPAKFRV